MACPTCGKSSPCVHEQQSTPQAAGAEHLPSRLTVPVAGGDMLGQSSVQNQADEQFWRQEVISRLQQHRARRRKRSDSQATLELDFQDGMTSSPPVQQEPQRAPRPRVPKADPPKIIEFPRPAAPAPQPVYYSRERSRQPEELELAEPIIEAPRILEAPEPSPQQLTLLPTFADIQLEAEETRRQYEVDVPLQPAAIGFRLFAGLVDMVVVLMAAAIFAVGMVMFAQKLPQSRIGILCGLVLTASLWLIYQYLFLVYSSVTPGMRLAQLELCTFKGEPASIPLRRWRALASLLSALAMGLGFAWALVDEDTLGWHDRITQTHLRHSAVSPRPEKNRVIARDRVN